MVRAAADSADLAAVLVAIGVQADGGVAVVVVVVVDGVPVVLADLRAAAVIAKLLLMS